MKITTENNENSQVVLRIEIEPEEMERSLDRAYRRVIHRVDIPGFRRGKAPRILLERYLGRDVLIEEALEPLIAEMYGQAVQEQKLEPMTQPQIEIIERDPPVFKATVPLRPPIEMGDYHRIRIPPEPVEVTQGQVDDALKQLRQQQALWEPVERPVASGDLVTLGVESTVEGEKPSSQEGIQYEVVEGSAVPVAGFAEEVVGMTAGQEKEFSLTFPTEHANPNLADKGCTFKVTVHEVKERQLPELDDDFARSLGGGFDNLEGLRERLFSDLLRRAQAQANERYEEKVTDSVVELANVELPPLLVEHEVDHLFEEEARLLQRLEGGIDAYLSRVGKSEAGVKEELQPVATKRLMRSLVLNEVARLEGIEVSPEEVEVEIENTRGRAGQGADELQRRLSSLEGRSSVEQWLLTRKTMDRLVEIAQDKLAVENQASEEAA